MEINNDLKASLGSWFALIGIFGILIVAWVFGWVFNSNSACIGDGCVTPDPEPETCEYWYWYWYWYWYEDCEEPETPETPGGGSSSWGGGSWLVPDECTDGDFSGSAYDWKCWEKPNNNTPGDESENPWNEWGGTNWGNTPPSERICKDNSIATSHSCVFPNIDITFSDIENSFAKDYILSLGRAGIVQWYFNTSLYQPQRIVSRAEYLKIVLRAFCVDYVDVDTTANTFRDISPNAWEAKVIGKWVEIGAVDPSNSFFRPEDGISRAEALKMLVAVSGVDIDESFDSRFDDVVIDSWEAKYINTIDNMCIVDGTQSGGRYVFDPQRSLSREEVAKIVAKALELK